MVAVPGLLATATLDARPDRRRRPGRSSPAAALLLAARSYRHALARSLLRIAGLYAWVALVVTRLLRRSPTRTQWYVVGAALALAAAVLVAAVATGRGWRSVWWARRAEIGESLCGAFAVAVARRRGRAVPAPVGADLPHRSLTPVGNRGRMFSAPGWG